jgi:hypothetical protein
MSGLDDCASVLEDILNLLKKATEPKSSNKKSTALQSDDSGDEGPPAPVRSERIENMKIRMCLMVIGYRLPSSVTGLRKPQKVLRAADRCT